MSFEDEAGFAETANADGQALSPPMPTWDQLQARVSKTLVAPLWVVRPAPIEVSRSDAGLDDGDDVVVNPKPAIMCGIVLRSVFRYLSVNDLLSVMRTCRVWARWSIHPTLWPHITLPPNKTVEPVQMQGIVRRQPRKLTLNWVAISQEQLKWLLMRLPQLSELDCEGLSWGEVRCLATCFSPPLVKLDLNFVEGINDDAIKLLLSSPVSRRPGFRNHQSSRLKNLTHLSLAGAWISDSSIRELCTELQLVHFDISNCLSVSEETIQIIAEAQSKTLESLDVSSCASLGPLCLPDLAKFKLLSRLAISHCPLIPAGAIRAWSQTHGYSEGQDRVLTRVPPSVRQVNMAIQSRLVKTAFAKILEKLTQKVDFGKEFDDSSVNGAGKVVEQKLLCDSKPSTSGSSLISSSFEKSEDSSKETGHSGSVMKESSSHVVERGSRSAKKNLISLKESANNSKTQSEKDETSETEEKEDELGPSNVKLNKFSSVSSHSEKSPTRSRRRPSRFSDPDVEFSSPTKNPRKKMKQVTVALEDIGASTKFTTKRPLEGSKKRDLLKPIDASKRKVFIGPKSRCPPRLEEPVTDVKTYDASESDVSLVSVDALDDSLDSPRRTQRRSRDTSLEELKEKPAPKDSPTLPEPTRPKTYEDDETIPECVPKASPIKKKSIDEKVSNKKRDGYPEGNLPKKCPKKEKDIMTRSKRLKQDPTKALHTSLGSISPELKSPRVIICRKEVESVPGKARSKCERIKAVTRKIFPESEGKSPKRPRSALSTDVSPSPSSSRKFPSELKVREPVYSSKLRKKSSEGVVAPDPPCKEDFEPENLKKEEIHESPRSRRRSHKDEGDKSTSDDRQGKSTVESSPVRESELLLSSTQRPCRRKTDDCESLLKDTKVDDCRVETKKKKAMAFKQDSKKIVGSSSVLDKNDSSAREVEFSAFDSDGNKTVGEREDVSDSIKSSKLQSTGTASKSVRREKLELPAANDCNNGSTTQKHLSSSTAVEDAKPTLLTKISKKSSIEKLSGKRKDSDSVKDTKLKAAVSKRKESGEDVSSHIKIKECKPTPKSLEEKGCGRSSQSCGNRKDPIHVKRATTVSTIDQKKDGTGPLACEINAAKKSLPPDKLILNIKMKNKEEKSGKIKIKGELLEENKQKLLESDKNVKKVMSRQKEGADSPPTKLGQRGSNLGESVKVETEPSSKDNQPSSSKLCIESTLGINKEQPGTKKVQGKEELKSAGDATVLEHSKETRLTADKNRPLSRNKDVVPNSIKIEEAPKCSAKTGNISVFGNTGTIKEKDRIKESELSKELQKHFPPLPKGVYCKSEDVTKTLKCDKRTSTSAGTDVSAVKEEDHKRLLKSSCEKLLQKKIATDLSSKDSSLEESSDIGKSITALKPVSSTVQFDKTSDKNKGVKTMTSENPEKDSGNTSKSTIKQANLHSGKDIKEVTKSAKTIDRATQPESARTTTTNAAQSTSGKKVEQSSLISSAGKRTTANKSHELGSRKELASNLKETPVASGSNNGKPCAATNPPGENDDNTYCAKTVDVCSNKDNTRVDGKNTDTDNVDSTAKKVDSDARMNAKNKESGAKSITSSIQKADATIKPKETSNKEIESASKSTVQGANNSSFKAKLASNDANILEIVAAKPVSVPQEKSTVDSESKMKSLSKAAVTSSSGTPASQSGNGNSGNDEKKTSGDGNKSEVKETVCNSGD